MIDRLNFTTRQRSGGTAQAHGRQGKKPVWSECDRRRRGAWHGRRSVRPPKSAMHVACCMSHVACCILHPAGVRYPVLTQRDPSSSALCGPPPVPQCTEFGARLAEHAEGTLDLPSELLQDALAQINQLHTRSCVPTPGCGQDARAWVWECAPATTGRRHRPTLLLCAHTTPESASRGRTHSAKGSTCAHPPSPPPYVLSARRMRDECAAPHPPV